MFDINAPLERQRSGARKLAKLIDSGLDVNYPLVAWVQGEHAPESFDRDGMVGAVYSAFVDLHTLPEPLPLIVSYHNVYADGVSAPLFSSTFKAGIIDTDCIASIKITFDPNITESIVNSTTVETLWKKGG